MAEDELRRFAGLIERYHDTLDLVSAKALGEIDALIAEAKLYAEVIVEVAGPKVAIVDLGSGAGLPGVVLAVTLPNATVHLVERRRRRAAFLSTVVAQLALGNARVWTSDAKDLEGICADVVTAQAVSTFASIAALTRHLHRDPCYIVSRKGPDWLAEIEPLLDAIRPSGADFDAPGASMPQGSARRAGSTADRSGAGRPADEPGQGPATAAAAENTPAVTVAAERRVRRGGSLVALRLSGGAACRSSA